MPIHAGCRPVILRGTEVEGCYVIAPERLEDARGFFARTYDRWEFEERGLNPRIAQSSISYNPRKGTLRGMHYQIPPFQEVKLVRCTRGSIHDVAVDLRPGSPTHMRHAAVDLDAQNRLALYVPEGCAHGFLTLEDDCEVFYQISERHSPDHARGIRWDDPALSIRWPGRVEVISDRDRSYPDLGG
jgi:dTDP-4-dehydrorhamnose 3,5-epimerase